MSINIWRNERLQHLHKCMMQYGNKTGDDMRKMKGEIYARHGINSRTQLTDDQLEEEILFFTSI